MKVNLFKNFQFDQIL